MEEHDGCGKAAGEKQQEKAIQVVNAENDILSKLASLPGQRLIGLLTKANPAPTEDYRLIRLFYLKMSQCL